MLKGYEFAGVKIVTSTNEGCKINNKGKKWKNGGSRFGDASHRWGLIYS
jgi:hypothetical protein